MVNGGFADTELIGEVGIGEGVEPAFHNEFDGDLDEFGFAIGGHGLNLPTSR